MAETKWGENRKSSGKGIQEEPPEDYYVLQRNQGECGPKISQDSMRNWSCDFQECSYYGIVGTGVKELFERGT